MWNFIVGGIGLAAIIFVVWWLRKSGYNDAAKDYERELMKKALKRKAKELDIEKYYAKLARVIDNNWDSVSKKRLKGKINLNNLTKKK